MTQTGTYENHVVNYLKKMGEPVNRENYLSLAYFGVSPKDYTDEMEQEWRDVSRTIREGW